MEYSRYIPYSKKNEIMLVEVYFWNIPEYSIFQKFEIMLVKVSFWNIPGIFHIPENLKITMFRFFSGIFQFVKSHIPWNIPSKKKMTPVFWGRKV